MKLRIILSGLVLFFVFSACTKGQAQSNSLLWKVSGNGLSSPSYLFGTHHLVPISFLDEINGLDEAFSATQQVIGELDMSKKLSMQMKILSKAMLPKGYDYKTLLSKDDYALLEQKVSEIAKMKLSKLDKLKPAMINNLLMIFLYQDYYPNTDIEKGIDEHFQGKAKKNKMKVAGLESADDQMYVLLEMQSIERQAELLMCSLKHPELLKEQMDKLQTAYHNQDIAALAALFEYERDDDPCPSTDEEKYEMNAARNKKWLQELPQMMKDTPSFVAVGCLHLVGKDGLIEGLRKSGYKVVPIK